MYNSYTRHFPEFPERHYFRAGNPIILYAYPTEFSEKTPEES